MIVFQHGLVMINYRQTVLTKQGMVISGYATHAQQLKLQYLMIGKFAAHFFIDKIE